MDIEALVANALATVPRAQAVSVVDLSTGMFLALKATSADPRNLDLMAASAREVFAGDLAAGLRISIDEAHGEHAVEEVMVTTGQSVLMFVRMALEPGWVLAVACDRDVGLGMLIAKTRELSRIR